MLFEQIKELITTIGFPIAVAIWFMFESNKTQKDLTKAVNHQSEVLSDLKNAVKELKRG